MAQVNPGSRYRCGTRVRAIKRSMVVMAGGKGPEIRPKRLSQAASPMRPSWATETWASRSAVTLPVASWHCTSASTSSGASATMTARPTQALPATRVSRAGSGWAKSLCAAQASSTPRLRRSSTPRQASSTRRCGRSAGCRSRCARTSSRTRTCSSPRSRAAAP